MQKFKESAIYMFPEASRAIPAGKLNRASPPVPSAAPGVPARPAIVVTNEVGLGVVPATPLGRRYRDALGRVNQLVASAADEVILLVSGIDVRIKPRG